MKDPKENVTENAGENIPPKGKSGRKINLIEAAMKYKEISLILTILLMALGGYALLNMPRQEFPQFTIRQGLVVGVYPGASSKQVEERMTTEVENYLFGYQEVNKLKTYSISKEGMMIMFVELRDGVKNPDMFWSKLRHGLNELKNQLPPEVLALIANNDFGDTSALLLTITSEKRTYKELEAYLKKVENELIKIEGVSKLKHFGLQKEQVLVHIQPEKLQNFNIKPITVLSALRTEGTVSYAGNLDNGNMTMPLHLPARYQTEKDLANQIIYADPQGNLIRLKDVARIERRYKTPDSFIKYQGTKSLLLSLEMQPGNNIVQFGEAVDQALAKAKAKLPGDVKMARIADMPNVVDHAISHFMKEFGIAVLAVIVVTMLLLPFRVSAVAGITIPISILITLGILSTMGIELHTVSLAALIVVLGMVVDNSIVIIDNHLEKLDHGESPWNAAWKSATELFLPVFSATLAIAASYFPLMFFLRGTAGDFIQSFPVTIAIALGASLLVAGLLVPYMCFVFIKKGFHNPNANKKKRASMLDYLQKGYDWSLERAFKAPPLTIGLGIASIVVGVILAATLPQQLFPQVERDQFAIEVYLPEGKALKRTAEVVNDLEDILDQDKRVRNVTSFVGSSSPRFHTVYAPNIPSKNYAQLLINTTSSQATEEVIREYSKKYEGYFPDARIKWKQLNMSGSKAPIEVRISGDSIPLLKKTAAKVANILKQAPEVTWVRDNFAEARQAVEVSLLKEQANRMGLSKTMLSTSLAIGMQGLPVVTLWEGDYPVQVLLIQDKDRRDEVKDIGDQYVTSPMTFASMPIRSITKLKPEWTEGQIIRRNGVKTLTVRADVAFGVIASEVFKGLKPQLDELKLPKGVQLAHGGEFESSWENYIPMGYSMGTSIAAIFLILLFQFKRVKLATLIMSTMPLSIFGATLGLQLTGYPFGFTAFMGLISLMGIVVRNGIILVEYAEELFNKEGMTIKEAALSAGKRRMRPIFLTSAAAAIGVVPMILSGSPLWGPLGTVICFGLTFSMILTLFVLPVLYWLFFYKKVSV